MGGPEIERTWTWSGLVTAKLTNTNATLLPVPSTPRTSKPNQVQKVAMPTNSKSRSWNNGDARAGHLVNMKMYELAKRLKRAKHMMM